MQNAKPIVCAVSPAGQRFRLRFDGFQDFAPMPAARQAQYTALEEIPGLVPEHGTTYACTVIGRGFRIEPQTA